jgi:ERF superfamily
MHRSSDSIASLAAALAKAQTALTNPEKSLTGTVPAGRGDEPPQTFRYAPLSSGLDIVRKTLGEQGIATLQTTTIDQDIQTVSLTTALAHASGEWIASDWPVCLLSDMAAPRRMGAALTYARRYALFTLVGIAGEDDLDAPDLSGQPAEGTGKTGDGLDTKHRGGNAADQPLGRFAAGRRAWSPPKQAPEPDKSAASRDRLLGELSALAIQDEATAWAHKAMAAKNTLTTADCGIVEAAFAARVAELDEEGAGGQASSQPSEPNSQVPRVNNAVAWHIDKADLPLGEPRRYRDRAHIRFVSAQPCLICARRPSDAHHLRFAQPRALGRRVSDEFTVPLCRSHHRALHRHGDEAAWWESNKVDAVVAAHELWQRTRLDGLRGGRSEALVSEGVIESSAETRTLGHVSSNRQTDAPGVAGQ